MQLSRTIVGGVAALALAGLVTAGTAIASAAPQPPPTNTAQEPPRKDGPEPPRKELRQDLRKVTKLPDAARDTAVDVVFAKALLGGYGKQIKKRAMLVEQAPAALKADLKAALVADLGERREALVEVGKKAVAGGYGEAVQQVATKVKDRRDARKDRRDGRQERRADRQELRQDLRKVTKFPDAARGTAVDAIFAKALLGGYGEQVKKRAMLVQQAPAALKADLKAALVADLGERREALAEVGKRPSPADTARRSSRWPRRSPTAGTPAGSVAPTEPSESKNDPPIGRS